MSGNAEPPSRSKGSFGMSLRLLALGLFVGCTAQVGGTDNGTPGTPAVVAPPVMCTLPLTACGQVCVDISTDLSNCGVCGRACAAGEICDQGTCSINCVAGRTLCGATCADTLTDSANCGTCGMACSAERSCSGGQCVCPVGQNDCGGVCSDPLTDASNCGSCGNACMGGQTCQQGACACPLGATYCGTACVDTQTSSENCGTCGTVCVSGQVCQAGLCACPSGTNLCGDTCTDVQSDDLNCGACGQVCELGQTCAAGACGGGGGAREDGCEGLAQDVSVSSIDAYQTLQIPIAESAAEVAPDARNADVVTGRDTLFSIGAQVAAGFSSRELSARLFIENADGVQFFYAKRTLSQSSTDDPESRFSVLVPKEAITADARYAIEVAECAGTGSGSGGSPRFPSSGGLDLGAREVGGLKVAIVPVRANNRSPETTESALEIYKSWMMAMYPISSIEMTVVAQMDVGYPIDWSGTLDQVRARRGSDAPEADVYYYALLAPTATFREFCGGGCTAGIGYVVSGGGGGGFGGGNQASQRAAVGIGWSDLSSATTMAHEVGHNHGRNHAPCVDGGSISGVDQSYPYDGGAIGVIGYDPRSMDFFDPDSNADIMGYCRDQWISDYTYQGLVDRVATVNGFQSVVTPPEQIGTWQVLLLDQLGARWGIPIDEPTAAAGVPEPAEILDRQGTVIETVDVYRTEISDIGAWSIWIPSPQPDWYGVRVQGAPEVAFVAP